MTPSLNFNQQPGQTSHVLLAPSVLEKPFLPEKSILMVGFFWFLFSGCIHIILTSTVERTQCKYFSKGINALDNSLIKLTLISAAQSHVGGRARSCTHPQFWHTLSSLSACKGVFPLWWIGDKSLPLKAIDVSVLTSGDRGMGNAAEPRDLCLSHPPRPLTRIRGGTLRSPYQTPQNGH